MIPTTDKVIYISCAFVVVVVVGFLVSDFFSQRSKAYRSMNREKKRKLKEAKERNKKAALK
jgi:Mg2+/Co2+ transporter CorB